MPTVEERIALAVEERGAAETRFREALRAGRDRGMSWSQLARASGMSIPGVRYLTLDLNSRRAAEKAKPKKGGRKRK